jgi:hypothetical protein
VTANVPPKVVQTLARHSTITVTMDRYARLGVFDLVDALKRLRVISVGPERVARQARTAPANGCRQGATIPFCSRLLRQWCGVPELHRSDEGTGEPMAILAERDVVAFRTADPYRRWSEAQQLLPGLAIP